MAKDDDQPVVTFEDPPVEDTPARDPGWHNLADESDVEVVEGEPPSGGSPPQPMEGTDGEVVESPPTGQGG